MACGRNPMSKVKGTQKTSRNGEVGGGQVPLDLGAILEGSKQRSYTFLT